MSCTMFPRMKLNVENCCKQHDRDYSRYSTISRAQADWNFFKCVSRHNKFYAIIMYVGVRLFGHRYFHT